MKKKEEKQKDIYELEQKKSFENEACKNCSNHPKNGGSGICHCILGLLKIFY